MSKVERINGKTAGQIMGGRNRMMTYIPYLSKEWYMHCANGQYYYCNAKGDIQESAIGATHIKVVRTGPDYLYYIAGMLPIPENKRI